jgi:hypothetical protein
MPVHVPERRGCDVRRHYYLEFDPVERSSAAIVDELTTALLGRDAEPILLE